MKPIKIDEKQQELGFTQDAIVIKGFGRFHEATERQKDFAKKIGLDLEGVPQNVAVEMLECLVHAEFFKKKVKPATEKQIELGKKFGFELSDMSSAIAGIYIKNILWELNYSIIKQQQLGPGVWTTNIHNGEIRQISSIDKNCFVSFTDMHPPKRLTRSLRRCNAPCNNEPVFEHLPLAEMTHEQLFSKLFECILLEAV